MQAYGRGADNSDDMMLVIGGDWPRRNDNLTNNMMCIAIIVRCAPAETSMALHISANERIITITTAPS